MKAEYIPFYIDGRNSRLLKNDIDADELADKIAEGGGTLYEVIHAACVDAAKEIQSERHRKKWLSDNKEQITEAGGDGEVAWQHFIEGKIDELCGSYEDAVVEALADGDEDEDEDEDDEGEDEDGEGEDEDGDEK